ncbi:hypothetical protein BDV95DRAFT_580602 [Massariosphaeria phaeospora]|uniref:Uncharacterized protein n=1 Tax=Massariosphaeria phaeospora TaxID=100035 RepID=A0A7C8M4H7_9PLEO|nr:hypothetical protein BDV95DRAFT_580602 [Massariosphaeria phaeospora]
MHIRRQFHLCLAAAWMVILIVVVRWEWASNLGDTWKDFRKTARLSRYEATEQIPIENDKNDITAAPTSGSPSVPRNWHCIPLTTSTVIVSSVPKSEPTPLPKRVVVMGKLESEDTSWVNTDLSDWHHAIYVVDGQNFTTPDSSILRTPINKGNEALPYLTYLVTNYHSLPATIAFVHSHRDGFPRAWHTDAPNHSAAAMLKSLNIDFIQRNGYANLRCIADPGCPAEVQSFRDPPEAHRTIESAMPDAWRTLFDNSTVPPILATPCCSQFAVSRDQVLTRPLADYEKYRDWLIETELDDDTSGRVFEYLWHVIFGQEPVYCPSLERCYCDVYGRC